MPTEPVTGGAPPPAPPPESPVAAPGEAGPAPSRRLELLFVFILWAIATAIIWRLSVGHVAPRRFQDEFLWASVAESLANGDGLSWRGESLGIKSPLYPLGIAPAYLIGGSTESIYHTIHLINSMMMCAVVFPVYYGARRYMDTTLAFVAALLALSAPGMNYAGVIGTEALAYPMAAFAGLSIAYVAARPSRKSWIVAAVAVLLAILTRTQFAVFAAALPGAVLLAGMMREPEERRAYFRAQATPLKLMGGLLALGVVATIISPKTVVGLYEGALYGGIPEFGDMWFWLRGFTADVFIVGGVIPVIAAIAMALDRENRRDPLIGALLAATFVCTVLFVAEVSWFSATNVFNWRERHIFYERYMFYLGPLYFVILMTCWRRISVSNVLIATGIGALALSGLHQDNVLVPFSYDSFGLTVIGWLLESRPGLGDHLGLYAASLGVVFGWVLAAAAVVKRPQVARIGAAAALAITFVVLLWNQGKTWQYARFYSPIAFSGVPKPADWIDRRTDRDVAMLITSTDPPEAYFSTEFWNKRVTRALATDRDPIKSPVMYSPRCGFDWTPDGTIVTEGCDPVPTAFYVRNGTMAIHLKEPEFEFQHKPDQRLLVSKGKPQLLSILNGRDVTTSVVNGEMTLRTFLDRPGVVRMKVKVPDGTGRVLVGDRSIDLPKNRLTNVDFAVPAGERLTTISFVDREDLAISAEVAEIELVTDRGRVYDLR